MRGKGLLGLGLAVAGLAACTPQENAPLYFGQVNTLGVSVGGGTTGTTPDVTVGFKSADLAIVPTVNDQNATAIRATQQGGQTVTDALSTFGSFDSQTREGQVSIGTFFSTGLPGQRLAVGLGCAAALKAANGQGVTCQIQ